MMHGTAKMFSSLLVVCWMAATFTGTVDAASWTRTRTDVPDESTTSSNSKDNEPRIGMRSSPTSSKPRASRKKGTAVMAHPDANLDADPSSSNDGDSAGNSKHEPPDIAASLFASFSKIPCHENGAVHAWCSSSISDPDLECAIHPSTNIYACRCDMDPSHCPTECIDANRVAAALSSASDTSDSESQTSSIATQPLWTTPHSIVCHGIPQDEPNYVVVHPKEVTATLPLHHCENNALVANWCNEALIGDVGVNTDCPSQAGLDCLLLPALDEYVCTCYGNRAACPQDCVNGAEPDRVSAHAIRCRGIPQDTPNYVLMESAAEIQHKDTANEDMDDWIR